MNMCLQNKTSKPNRGAINIFFEFEKKFPQNYRRNLGLGEGGRLTIIFLITKFFWLLI